MTVLAIVPARGGSQGVRRKNLREVGGISLVGRAVRAARECELIHHVVVSTEDKEIRAEALRYGAEVPFARPPELADDATGTLQVVAHAVEQFERLSGLAVGTVVLLEPTSPFRTASHVRWALTKHAEGRFRTTITVCPLERKPENIFVKADALVRYIKQPHERFIRRQDMQHLCRLNSAVYVLDRQALFAEQSLLVDPIGYVEMSALESVNIDEELDLEWAQFLADKYGL